MEHKVKMAHNADGTFLLSCPDSSIYFAVSSEKKVLVTAVNSEENPEDIESVGPLGVHQAPAFRQVQSSWFLLSVR